jgi:hypothetical protein
VDERKPLDAGAAQEGGAGEKGTAVQVDPIKPKLKPTGTERLKQNCDILLSNSAFNVNLRRYKMDKKAMQA